MDERNTWFKWCRLMNPEEGDNFGSVFPVVHHGEPDDPRCVVCIRIGGRTVFRNIFDVMFLNVKKRRVRNPWLCPGTSQNAVCECLGIGFYTSYSDEFLSSLAATGYPYPPKKTEPVTNR